MISDHISNDIPPQMKNFKYGYPHSNAFLQSLLTLECWRRHKVTHHPTKCDKINEYISQDILSQIFDSIQSDVTLQKPMY